MFGAITVLLSAKIQKYYPNIARILKKALAEAFGFIDWKKVLHIVFPFSHNIFIYNLV